MIKQICILTKSYKHGGYCVAGIDINTKQWIRLVNSNNPETDEIRKDQLLTNGKSIECFDVIEFDFLSNIPTSCQTENWLLNPNIKPKYINTLTIEQILHLISLEKDACFISNDSNLLSDAEILNLKRSLYLFYVNNLDIEATSYESYGEIKFKYKCSFYYNNKKYTNISLTDPIYRDLSQDGLKLNNCLVVASLPCIPYKDNMFYKFVAKIIPVDKDISLCIENLDEINALQDTNKNNPSPFIKSGLVVKTQQWPGTVIFENYEQIKTNITKGVAYYSCFEYSLDNYQMALNHHNELKYVKNVLEKTKRELIKNYNAPLQIVEAKIDELIDLIKIPFKKVDSFIKQNEKNAKKYEIYIFAKNEFISNGLEDHMENILKSPAFFDLKWLNTSCSKSAWRSAVSKKIKDAGNDIKQILSMNNENVSILLANYYQTLSLNRVEEFLNSIKIATTITEKTSLANNSPKVTDLTEKTTQNTNNPNTFITDFDVLNSVANSFNPFTKSNISGIDECLKSRLIELAKKINAKK